MAGKSKVRVQRSVECGNSPKSKLLEDLFIMVIHGDDKRLSKFSDEPVKIALPRKFSAGTMVVENIAHHGRSGFVYGALRERLRKEDLGVCVMFEFTSASMKKLAKAVLFETIFEIG